MKSIVLVALFSLLTSNLLATEETEDQKMSRYAKEIYKLYNKQIKKDQDNWSSAADQTSQMLVNTMDKKLHNRFAIIKDMNGQDYEIDSQEFYYFDVKNGVMVSSDDYSSIFRVKEFPESPLIKLKYNLDYGKILIWADNGASGILNINDDLTVDWSKIVNMYKFIGGKI